MNVDLLRGGIGEQAFDDLFHKCTFDDIGIEQTVPICSRKTMLGRTARKGCTGNLGGLIGYGERYAFPGW